MIHKSNVFHVNYLIFQICLVYNEKEQISFFQLIDLLYNRFENIKISNVNVTHEVDQRQLFKSII